MISPPHEEPKLSPKYHQLNWLGVAVASLVACGATKTAFDPQISLFYLIISISVSFYPNFSYYINDLFICLLPISSSIRSQRI
jgi:hypothetical protein